MAYMKKFKTSPSATALDIYAKLADKDANGKDIDTYVAGGTLIGTDLSLYDGQANPVSTIDLSGIGGSGAYIILTGAYNSMFNALIISSVTSDTGHTITDMQDMYDAIKNDGATVYLVDETNNTAEIIPLSYIYENALDPDAFDVGFVGVTKGWVSTRSPSDTLSGTPWTAYTPGGSGSSAITSANIYCGSTSLWTVASNSPANVQVNEVIIDGQTGQGTDLPGLIQLIVNKFSNPGTDIKMSISGTDWSAEILNYSINSNTVTIYFEVCGGGVSYKKYAMFDNSSYTGMTINQAQ